MADSLEGGVAALEAELVAIEQRRIETEAELKAAKLARTRLLDTACSPWQLLADCLAYEIKLCNGIPHLPFATLLLPVDLLGLRGIEWVSLGSEGPRKLCIS